MSIRLSTSSMIAYSSTMIFILLALYASAERSGPFHFMKDSYRWPTSYCLGAPLIATAPQRTRCQEPFKKHFIVRGSWPMYSDDDDTVNENVESIVPAYNQSNCSEIRPPSASNIKNSFFNKSLPLLVAIKYWPNIYKYSNVDANIDYWRGVWSKYGKCSQNRDNPFLYFKKPIDYLREHNFLKILAADGIKADGREYEPFAIRDAIWNGLRQKPQIRCISDINNKTLLNEIMLCFDRDGLSMPCRYDFFGCPEFDPEIGPDFKIKFPAPLMGYPTGY